MTVFIVTLSIFCLTAGLMGIGVIMGRKALRGSCGGPDACLCVDDDGNDIGANCPTRRLRDAAARAAGAG